MFYRDDLKLKLLASASVHEANIVILNKSKGHLHRQETPSPNIAPQVSPLESTGSAVSPLAPNGIRDSITARDSSGPPF